MKVLITGARGFIGRHVARQLAARGHFAVGLGHGGWPEQGFRAWGLSDWLNGEITHSNLDALAAKHGAPDSVIHLAGGSSVGFSISAPGEDFRRSVSTSAELIEWIRLRTPASGVVLASSAAVYGSGYESKIAESMPCQPLSPYGFHKRLSEMLFESYSRNFGLSSGVVRLFSVYGPELRKQLLWDACSSLATRPGQLELGGTGNETRDWFHVEDAARLLVLMLGRVSPTCPIVNGGTGVATSVREVAEHLCACWGAGGVVRFSGRSRSGDPAHLVADTGRLSEFGFADSLGWKEGILDYVRWFKVENGITH